MVARADLEEFRAANASLSQQVQDTLEAFFLTLDLTNPDVVRDALVEFVPLLTSQFGQVAATLAAEWYEELRAGSGVIGRFRVSTAPSVAPDAVEAQVRYLAGHLWTPEPAAILEPLLTNVDKYVKQPGRETITMNSEAEGVYWARVPTGEKTCSFCMVLASRDAVYTSRKAATSRRSDGDRYHGRCDCVAVPLRSFDDYPEGYDPEELYEMYSVARDESGSGDLKDIVAAFRRTFPDYVNDGVQTQ